MSRNLTFSNSQFTLISQVTFAIARQPPQLPWEMINDKLMLNDKCELKNSKETA